MLDRRSFGLTLLASLGASAAPGISLGQQAAAPAKAASKLVLIGTKGGPRIGGPRLNPSNLLLIEGVPFVIDCGYGVARGIVSAGVPLPSIRYLFITHHHSDHNLEYGNIVDAAWSSGLNAPIRAFGPKGTVEMTDLFWKLNKFDVETRIADEGKPDPRKLLQPTDIAEGGMLTPGSFTAEVVPGEGQSVVGVALSPAQAPGLHLEYGDHVRVVVTPAQGEELPAGTPLSTDATVVGVHTAEDTGQAVVDLLVPKADSAVLATRIATGNIALVLDSRER